MVLRFTIKHTGKTVFMGLDDNLARFICNATEKFNAVTVIHKDDKTYADREKAQNVCRYDVNSTVEHLIKDCCIHDDKFKETFMSGGVESVALFFKSEEEQKQCYEILSANPKLCVAKSWERNLEVFCKAAGKGSALKILSEKLGIDMEDTISIGDSDNDIQMTLMA